MTIQIPEMGMDVAQLVKLKLVIHAQEPHLSALLFVEMELLHRLRSAMILQMMELVVLLDAQEQLLDIHVH